MERLMSCGGICSVEESIIARQSQTVEEIEVLHMLNRLSLPHVLAFTR